ncbi:hypothetical protein B5F07_20235 [Lachnoclostridium sp. An169]|uniref:pectin acetylesterase-family hydrolase n=1 Tax=Lachnoclostridium sp. An169 TaxID=1965569 RepID=UPI000B3728D9|nr:pectin acetylesterase-family hydrolase [Lachnoclostridium sp. An169]OUP80675.1 hypothetical protein B5F07_20235 [Lachnoclostridium sp. An169]
MSMEDNIKQEPWEKMSDEVKQIWTEIVKKNCPEMPENPEQGTFYRIFPEGCVTGLNETYHGTIRIGKDPKKLIVFFNGGGLSWNAYTAAYPATLFSLHMPELYYFADVEYMGDGIIKNSIGSERKENPFKDWSVINILYATGDFHAGEGEFPYTALDGTDRLLMHHGRKNTLSLIEMAKQWLGEPETLLIAGPSAGGFGVALMADDIIEQFPTCKNITCLVDSSILIMDGWREIARDVWHAPEHIWKRLHSDNIMLDSYEALYQKYGEKVKYLFCSTIRDAQLSRMQNKMDGKALVIDKEGGIKYYALLQKVAKQLQEKVPGIGLYISDKKLDDPGTREAEVTQHCFLDTTSMLDYEMEGITPARWIYNATQGCVENVGLRLL